MMATTSNKASSRRPPTSQIAALPDFSADGSGGTGVAFVLISATTAGCVAATVVGSDVLVSTVVAGAGRVAAAFAVAIAAAAAVAVAVATGIVVGVLVGNDVGMVVAVCV